MSASFLKPLEHIAARRGRMSSVFADFVRLAACCLAPRTEDGRVSVREAEYLDVVGRYERPELDIFTKVFADMIMAYEAEGEACDLLGAQWLDYSSHGCKKATGEFYTPQCVSDMMARLGGGHEEAIAAGTPFRVMEPACGSGNLIIAYAKLFAPDHWHLPRFTAIDISAVACDMTFINTTLWSIPCEVYRGSGLRTITPETHTRYVNIHWLRCGEEEVRRMHSIIRLLNPPPAPDPEQAAPVPAPAPSEPAPFFTQPSLFGDAA